MIQLQYENRGAEKIAEIEALGLEAIQRCTVALWTACTLAVSRPNPPPYRTPSLPGEPPRLRTGHGQRNIVYEIDPQRLIGRVGVRRNAKYMMFLDLGTRTVLARPWLLATAKKIWKQLQSLAKGRQP